MRGVLAIGLLALGACDIVFGLERPDAPIDAGAPGDWIRIAAGEGHTCGIRDGDRLWCWGYNRFGQIGVGRLEPEVVTPTQVLPSTQWAQVSLGLAHSCGLQLDGSAWCWGANYDGQLGAETPGSSTDPIAVAGTWTTIVAGGDHTCGLQADASLWCWGRNSEGQIGNGQRADFALPTQIAGAWSSVAVGRRHTCALTDDHRRYCWGSNAGGELGIGTTELKTVPTAGADRPGEEQWRMLAAGDTVTCGITDAGALRCWGENRAGQLGDNGTMPMRPEPQPVTSDATDWIDVDVGTRFACARRADRTLWCWGDTGEVLPIASSRVPVLVDDGAWDAIALGRTHACRLAPDRGLYCAGDGSTGARGDGSGATTTPAKVADGIAHIDAGGTSACAIDRDGALRCWGDNTLGQLGDDSYLRHVTPQALAGSWSHVAAGEEHACGRRDGAMTCWGTNSGGSLGVTGIERSPSPLATTPDVAAAILEVSDHACASVGTTALWCWGRNPKSEMGGTAPVLQVPTQVMGSGAGGFKGIATGSDHTCVLGSDDKVRCVGWNEYGQLGDGTTTMRTTWGPTTTATTKRAIAAGYFHTCSIELGDGSARCWGRNSDGALGDGTTAHRPTAITPAGGHAFIALAAGELHTCGIDDGGRLWCWGANYRGQLGAGTLERSLVPIAVDGSDWAEVSAGKAFTCARKTTDELYCWGDNRDGQLGTGGGWSRAFTLVPMP